MDWMPTECLASIFVYLSHSDRLRVRGVCRQWTRAIDEWSLLQNTGTFSIYKDTQWSLFFSDSSKNPPYTFESIKYLCIESVSLHFQRFRHQWDELLPRLLGLSLISTDISSNDFISILSGCQGLRSLSLVHLRDLFLSGVVLSKEEDGRRLSSSLRGVKHLNLSRNSYMSDFIFSRLVVPCAKELESLSVSGCNILNGAVAPTSVFTFPEIMKILRGCGSRLQALNLSSTGLDDKGLIELSSLPLSLKNLNLSHCSGVSGEGLLALLESQRGLEVLVLDHSYRWMNFSQEDQMTRIAHHIARIPHVSMDGLYIPEDLTSNLLFKALSHQNAWKGLGLSGARIPGDALLSSNTAILSDNLRDLTLSNFSSAFTPGQYLRLLSSCINLVRLNLSGCTNLTDPVLLCISSHCTHLEYLNLNGCTSITDTGIGSPDSASYIQNCSANESFFIDDAERGPPSLRRLSKLREIHVSSLKISTSSIRHSFVFDSLVKLDVSFCPHLDDLSFAYLGEQCPHIVFLAAKNCSLSDVGFKALTRRLRVIEEIHVEGNQSLSSDSLADLPTHCRHLRILNVSHCYKISQESLEQLESAYSNLRLLRHMNSSSDLSGDSNFEDPMIKFKKSKHFKPWKSLLCCVSKPRAEANQLIQN